MEKTDNHEMPLNEKMNKFLDKDITIREAIFFAIYVYVIYFNITGCIDFFSKDTHAYNDFMKVVGEFCMFLICSLFVFEKRIQAKIQLLVKWRDGIRRLRDEIKEDK